MLLRCVPPAMPPGAACRQEGQRLFRILRIEHAFGFKQAYALAVMSAYGETCWKTERKIAQFVGCSRSTVAKAVKKAKGLGLLVAKHIRIGDIPPGALAPTKTGLSLRRFTAFGIRSLSRIASIWARNALFNAFREAKAADNRQDRQEARAACNELRGPPR
jgi:AraC-like DNA-binding protein